MALAAQPLRAQNCAALHHSPPSAAETAYLAGDYAKAVGLYQAALAKSPGDTDLTAGLVHILLRQQKVMEAADALQASIGSSSKSPTLMTLRGEVELREGDPREAAEAALASETLYPCNPRTMLLLSRLESLNSQYATAYRLLMSAHKVDPEDPEIRAAWIRMLPSMQRIAELETYLASPEGDSPEETQELQTELTHLKTWAAGPRKTCTVTSQTASSELPLVSIQNERGTTIAFGLDVRVNGHIVRLAIDTSYNARLPIDGVSGLLINESDAKHWKLEPIYQNEVPGVGPQGARAGYVAYADSISMGGIEFHNCAVQVMKDNFSNNARGLIGMDVLAQYLVTFDFPKKKLMLDPLPPRPQNVAHVNGFYDRTMVPEMKDYIPVYRSGTDVILPLAVNNKWPMLFVADTAIPFSALSPEATSVVRTGHRDAKYEAGGTPKAENYDFRARNIEYNFAGLPWTDPTMAGFDTIRFTDDAGTEVSGLMGLRALSRLTVHLDYRDGLVKFDYDPKRHSPLLF